MNKRQKARIIKNVSNQYTILIDDNAYPAVAMGKLRQQQRPLVGDFVEVEWLEEKWCIQSIYPRMNQLVRPMIANVDQAVIVMSMKDPNFSTTLIDRLAFLIQLADIEPILLITKSDLVDSTYFAYQELEDYRRAGYQVVIINPEQNLENLRPVFENKISVLTGQSGAGKSTFLNRLDASFSLATQETSKALGRGKHTTRHTQLFPVLGGWLGDTPGFSSLDFSGINKLELAQKIKDFKPYIGLCKYQDCIHQNEPGCVIKEKVEQGEISRVRYQHYIECIDMVGKKGYL